MTEMGRSIRMVWRCVTTGIVGDQLVAVGPLVPLFTSHSSNSWATVGWLDPSSTTGIALNFVCALMIRLNLEADLESVNLWFLPNLYWSIHL